MQQASTSVSHEVLSSWKEIAAYLDRGVRTVQRWETALNLPVRRPRGRQRSAVIALRSDLDQWLRSCPLHDVAQNYPNGAPQLSVLTIGIPASRNSNRQLLLESRALREDLHRSRMQVSISITRLVSTLGKMIDQPSQLA